MAAGLAIFAAIVIAVRFHFQASATSFRFLGLAVASAVNVAVFGRELWLRQKDPWLLSAALGLMVVAAIVFGWALLASRSARLKLIFEDDRPRQILRAGPYRRIRHPFYTSYILYWTGCAIATLHPVNLAYVALLLPLLWSAARAEEKGFEGSAHAADYDAYRRSAGLFWPKLWGLP